MKKFICKVDSDGLMEECKMIDGRVIEAENQTEAEKILREKFSPTFDGWAMREEWDMSEADYE
tara:strand:+ start:607 stop:795 length:189 start_codon:yes stop_codon:yes gene_type:complete